MADRAAARRPQALIKCLPRPTQLAADLSPEGGVSSYASGLLAHHSHGRRAVGSSSAPTLRQRPQRRWASWRPQRGLAPIAPIPEDPDRPPTGQLTK